MVLWLGEIVRASQNPSKLCSKLLRGFEVFKTDDIAQALNQSIQLQLLSPLLVPPCQHSSHRAFRIIGVVILEEGSSRSMPEPFRSRRIIAFCFLAIPTRREGGRSSIRRGVRQQAAAITARTLCGICSAHPRTTWGWGFSRCC